MAKAEDKPKRAHKANWQRDKKKGGYIVRVKGPHCTEFAGREVPVSGTSGDEQMVRLEKLIHSGTDDGKFDNQPGPYALYSYVPKPREVKEVEF
jgi:hypothetical protein